MNPESGGIPGADGAAVLMDDVVGPRLVARVEKLAVQGDEAGCDELAQLLLTTDWDIDIFGPRIVAAGLVQQGQLGVDRLAALFAQPAKKPVKVGNAVLSALWATADGRRIRWVHADRGSVLLNAPTIEAKQRAQAALDDIVAEAASDYDTFWRLLNFLSLEKDAAWVEEEEEGGIDYQRQFTARFFDLITHASIKISPSIIHSFEQLIAAEMREEEYQLFLARFPVFLDPLTSEMIEKQRLGIEHVTDFALRRHDGEYALVEIEKPQDIIFTNRGDFSAIFTHAYGQVLDFQQWVRDEVAYAQRLLPGISAPRGLLVMGRTVGLTTDNLRKLRAVRAANASIDILTYDDLIARANNLYRSLRAPHGR